LADLPRRISFGDSALEGQPPPRCTVLLAVPKSDFDRNLGRRLQRAREKAGWTQEALAFRVDIDPTTLSRYETGRLPVPIQVLWSASNALGVKLTTLLDFSREVPRPLRGPPVVPKRLPASERAVLEELWARLRPHDRGVLLDLARVLADRRSARKPRGSR
jgi:transcriptional regulator with XRE-family HTH domain